jgi:hypothetical protein
MEPRVDRMLEPAMVESPRKKLRPEEYIYNAFMFNELLRRKAGKNLETPKFFLLRRFSLVFLLDY